MEERLQTPYELFGIECSNGWKGIIQPIFDYIEEYNKSHDEKIEIFQVKEKFGTLRFYCSFYTDELNKLIQEAEEKSYYICELCGSTEHVGKTLGWILTCCEDCVKKICTINKTERKWSPLDKKDKNIAYYQVTKTGELIPQYNIEKQK